MCLCLDSRPYTLWEASDVSLTALSTLWEYEGNSGRSSLVSFSNASCSSWSEKSSVLKSMFTDAIFRKANQLWPVGSFSVNGCDLLQSLLGWLLTSDWKNFWKQFSDFQVIRLQHRVQDIFRQQCKSIWGFWKQRSGFFSLLFHPLDHVENVEPLIVKFCCLF